MVGHHVPQGAGLLVEVTTRLHAHGFRRGDLHVINVVVVPERLEQRVGKATDQDVLYRFLAQVVVDPIDLLLFHVCQQALVQRLGTGQVGAEGLLHHQPAIGVPALLQQSRLAQALGHVTKEARGSGQVEDGIVGIGLGNALAHCCIGGVLEEVTLQIADAAAQPAPEVRIQRLVTGLALGLGLIADKGFQAVSEALVGIGIVVDADDLGTVVEQPVAQEVVQRRNQQALDQVTIGAEKEQRGWRCSGGFGAGAPFLGSGAGGDGRRIGHDRALSTRAAGAVPRDAARGRSTGERPGFYCGISTWPPKPKRMADKSLSA